MLHVCTILLLTIFAIRLDLHWLRLSLRSELNVGSDIEQEKRLGKPGVEAAIRRDSQGLYSCLKAGIQAYIFG